MARLQLQCCKRLLSGIRCDIDGHTDAEDEWVSGNKGDSKASG